MEYPSSGASQEKAMTINGHPMMLCQHCVKPHRPALASPPALPPLHGPTPTHATFRGLPGHIRAPLAEWPREAFGLLRSGSHTGNVSAPWHEVAEVATCGVGEQARCILLLAGRTNGEQRRGGGKAGKEQGGDCQDAPPSSPAHVMATHMLPHSAPRSHCTWVLPTCCHHDIGRARQRHGQINPAQQMDQLLQLAEL